MGLVMATKWVRWRSDRRRQPSADVVARPACAPRPADLLADDRGATALEWTLLLAFIAIPAYWLFSLALAILVEHYKLITTLNALPFP